MTTSFLYRFLSRHKYAVISTITEDNLPESALIGFAVTEDLRIIFDTSNTSRKYKNLLTNTQVAIVIGWVGEQTVQYEGTAAIAGAAAINELFDIYMNVFPEAAARRKMKDTAYFCVEPIWIRYSDFDDGGRIEELRF